MTITTRFGTRYPYPGTYTSITITTRFGIRVPEYTWYTPTKHKLAVH